jgi:hypothetical protein
LTIEGEGQQLLKLAVIFFHRQNAEDEELSVKVRKLIVVVVDASVEVS